MSVGGVGRWYLVSLTPPGAPFDNTPEFIELVVTVTKQQSDYRWITLSPTPILCCLDSDEARPRLQRFIRELMKRTELRVVATVGKLFEGNIGSEQRFDFSVVGYPLSALREATHSLSSSHSWLSMELAIELDVSVETPTTVAGMEFGALAAI